MPSRNQVGGRNRERRRYPDLEEAIGYCPARYLDVPLLEPDSEGTPKIRVALAMISGISRLGVANAWLEAERRLERGGTEEEPGPRDQIVTLLDAKIEDLVEHGQRPDDLPVDDGPERYRVHDRDVPDKRVYLVRRELQNGKLQEVDREPIEDARDGTATAKLANQRADSTHP